MATSSTFIVHQDDELVYPAGLTRLPGVLERVSEASVDLESISYEALALAERAERLKQEIDELADFTRTRIEVNRRRERRRVRHRRPSTNGNGHGSRELISDPVRF